MNINAQQTTSEESLDQACAWVARLRSDTISAADKRQFANWLSTSAENRHAFEEITELWGDLGALEHMPIDQLFPEGTPTSQASSSANEKKQKVRDIRKSPRGNWGAPQWLLSGGLATCGVFLAAWISLDWLNTGKSSQQIYTTQLGEIRTLNLADGSEVKLNSNTELRVSYSRKERQTHLIRGEAFFEVARQTSRPFTVSAGSANIRVLGTEFNVELNPESTKVSVTEGTVSVSEAETSPGLSPESVRLTKNQKVSITDHGLGDVRPASPQEATDWTRGLLVFEKTPLKEALQELNRYLSVPATAAPQVEGRLVSGTFAISDPDNTLEAIATALQLQQDRSNSNLTILSPKHN
ncbi:FecR domain-containing protein [Microbulbifer sp. GL-2]|uniref:FecR family protein n=1 Tax=Microbulbifer sp. GL-2 TaxID=2591606 RepID=UPI001163D4BE|nr:FecR domain-containing protein [Microbulbifer sp. GL-2]BBM00511.1 sensor [Microbulbifer sp. GL-2]